MKIELLSENVHYTAVDLGRLQTIKDFSLIHPKLGTEIKGKVFLKEATRSTGTEISLNSLAPHTEVPYFHKHRKDEETYLILSGSGLFQVDDDCFPIQEGSVIRVAPEGVRSLRNTSDEQLVYLCIQSKAHSLEEHSSDDGVRVPETTAK